MSYRDTAVWQRGLEIAVGVYRLVSRLPRAEVFGLKSQMTRAAASIPCNIAEGWCRESARDKAHFMAIAHGSIAELETLTTLCERIGWFTSESTQQVRMLLDETGRMVTTLRKQLRNRAKILKPAHRSEKSISPR